MAVIGNGRLREAAETALDLFDAVRARRDERGAGGGTLSRDEAIAAAGEALADNPVLQSRLDGEKWWQNRLYVGPLAILAGWLLDLFGLRVTVTPEMIVGAGPVLELLGLAIAGAGAALAKSLPPIDWKRPWTALGIGRTVPRINGA